MPEQAVRQGDGVAGGLAADVARPGVDVAAGPRPRQSEVFPGGQGIGDRGEDVQVAQAEVIGVEIGGHQRGRRAEGRRDGLEGAALGGGTGEALVPLRQAWQGRPGVAGGVDIRQVDLGLDAFVADPVSKTSVDAEASPAGDGRPWQRHRRKVDRSVEALLAGRRRRGRPLDAAGGRLAVHRGGAADESYEVAGQRQRGPEGVDQRLAVTDRLAVASEIISVRQVIVQRGDRGVDEFGVARY